MLYASFKQQTLTVYDQATDTCSTSRLDFFYKYMHGRSLPVYMPQRSLCAWWGVDIVSMLLERAQHLSLYVDVLCKTGVCTRKHSVPTCYVYAWRS